MGTTYHFDGSITITPALNFTEIKTATKVALGMIRQQDKKYANEKNVFAQYMPLGLMLDTFDEDTENGVLTVTRGIGLEAPSREHFLPISMADFVRALMKALPGHEWLGEVTAVHEDGMSGYRLTVKDANGNSTHDPVKVNEVKGRAYMVWDDEPDEKVLISDLA